MIFFNVPSVQQSIPENFFGSNYNYGFISTLFSKQNDRKQIIPECDRWYNKNSNVKYWDRIITLFNTFGLIRTNSRNEILNIPLLDFMDHEYKKHNTDPAKKLFNFYLNKWQFPHPITTKLGKRTDKKLGFTTKNLRQDYQIIKPFPIILSILLELKKINQYQAFLKKDEYYWLGYSYYNPKSKVNILNYAKVANKIYKMRLSGGWKKFSKIKGNRETATHLSYPRKFLLNSPLLSDDHNIFSQPENDFYIGLELSYKDKVIKNEIGLSDKKKFAFNQSKKTDQALNNKFSEYINNEKAFEAWKKATRIFDIPPSPYDYKKFNKTISSKNEALVYQLVNLAELDKETKLKTRREQHILRDHLFTAGQPSKCCICNKNLPLTLLRAAHIQKRSKLNDTQKRDINVVMPACTLGCDTLFENGYIFIKKGVIKSNKKLHINTTPDLAAAIKKIVNSKCSFWNSKTDKYFKLHEKTHT